MLISRRTLTTADLSIAGAQRTASSALAGGSRSYSSSSVRRVTAKWGPGGVGFESDRSRRKRTNDVTSDSGLFSIVVSSLSLSMLFEDPGLEGSRRVLPRRRVFAAGVDSVGFIVIETITPVKTEKIVTDAPTRFERWRRRRLRKGGDRGCCERWSYQHRYGDDGERADSYDRGGDYENIEKLHTEQDGCRYYYDCHDDKFEKPKKQTDELYAAPVVTLAFIFILCSGRTESMNHFEKTINE